MVEEAMRAAIDELNKRQETIDALVAALEEVSKLRRVLRDEGLLEQVEDALALARL